MTLAAAALLLTAPPEAARADLAPVEIQSFGPSQADVYAAQGFYMYANLNRPLAGNEKVTITQNGNVIGICGAWWNPWCSAYATTDWSMNDGSTELTFVATLSGDGASGSASATVPVHRVTYNVEISRSQDSVTVGGSASVYARVTNGGIPNTPYYLHIRDDDTGQIVATCQSSNNDCGYGFGVGWDQNLNPQPKHFSAFVTRADGSDLASNVASTTIGVNRLEYNVEISRSQESMEVNGSASIYARITNGPIQNTPYYLHIRDDRTGQIVASCQSWNNDCGYGFWVGWEDNEHPGPRQFSAFVTRADGSDLASNIATTSIDVRRHEFGVVLDYAPEGALDIPGTGYLNARIVSGGDLLSSPFYLFIRNDDTGQIVAACRNPWNACGYQFDVGWESNAHPEDRHYSAFMGSGDLSLRPSNTATKTFSLNPRRFTVELTASQETFTSPGTLQLHAELSNATLAGTPYSLVISDSDTGQVLAQCGPPSASCDFVRPVSWGDLVTGGGGEFTANVNGGDAAVGNDATAAVDYARPSFNVELAFGDHRASDPEGSLPATASATPALLGTPFALEIRNDTDTAVASCGIAPPAECGATLGDGTYYAAVVASAGEILGRSGSWNVTDGVAKPGDESGVDLLLLARRLGSLGAVCDWLLTFPGSHTQGTSTSDEWNACDLGLRQGTSLLTFLKWLGTTALGVEILHQLENQFGHEVPPGDWGSPNDPGNTDDNADPPPVLPSVPPVPTVPTPDFNNMLDSILAKNPGYSRANLGTALRECIKVAARAFRQVAECTRNAMFVVSSDQFPNATKLEREAQAFWPLWGMPHVTRLPHQGSSTWYNARPECNEVARIKAKLERPGIVVECHEFPYKGMAEGGKYGAPRPRLRLIPKGENRSEGGYYGAFINSQCSLPEGAPFFYLPAPPRSSVPTMAICN